MTPPPVVPQGLAAPLISAVVCTYRRYDALAACLAALRAQTLPAGACEIIVVDNGEDEAGRAAFAWPGEVRLIVADRPGLSHARNLGVAAARGGIVAFIDDDALAPPGWLAAFLCAAREAPDAGALGGRVTPIWPQSRPDWLDPWHDGFLSIVDRGDAPRALAADEWLAGTNIAFTAAALRDAGPFAEHLGRFPGALLGNEEIALVARLRAHGWSVRYDPRIVVRHHVHAERLTHAWLRKRIVWQAVSDLLLDTDPDGADIAVLWRRVSGYLERLPHAYRGVVGLTRDEPEAAAFRAQGEAIAALVRLLAAHGDSLEGALLGAAR